jgi:hypothetical protein
MFVFTDNKQTVSLTKLRYSQNQFMQSTLLKQFRENNIRAIFQKVTAVVLSKRRYFYISDRNMVRLNYQGLLFIINKITQ